MKIPAPEKRKCSSCGSTVDVSIASGLCVPCAYRAAMGETAAERQTAPYIAEQEAKRAERKAARK